MKRAFASAALAVLLAMPASAAGVEKTQGVYVTFLSGLKADVGETAAKAEAALKGAGFAILASFDNGVPPGCQAKARTIVFASEPWAAEVLSGGADKAFGLPMRLAVYGDESGASVALVNPVSACADLGNARRHCSKRRRLGGFKRGAALTYQKLLIY